MVNSDQSKRVEGCPVCGKLGNEAGTKYCRGPATARHAPERWEWVEVVRADVFRLTVDALRVATTTVGEWETRHKVTHPDPEGFRRAVIAQGKEVLGRLSDGDFLTNPASAGPGCLASDEERHGD